MKAEWTNSDSLTTSQTTKAILVIDMPKSCDECEVRCGGYTAKEYSEKGIKRPSWCPLKPMPQKNEIKNEEEFMNVCGWMFEVQTGMDIGWNDCIDEILGETEW